MQWVLSRAALVLQNTGEPGRFNPVGIDPLLCGATDGQNVASWSVAMVSLRDGLVFESET